MTTPRGKNADYWIGYHEEAARQVRPGNFESLAQTVARALGRDNGRKQKIFERSPGVFSSMDAEELGRMSSTEMAARELKALGVDPGENDPVAILDAHHAGRQFARDYQIPGGHLTGGNRIQGNNGNKLIGGSASDSAESFVDKYLGS
jgi:hypothetical protein